MRKIMKMYNSIWERAEERNRTEPHRFYQISESRGSKSDPKKRYMEIGIYDSKYSKYCIFDTIALVANFRYNSKSIPAELREMERMVEGR